MIVWVHGSHCCQWVPLSYFRGVVFSCDDWFNFWLSKTSTLYFSNTKQNYHGNKSRCFYEYWRWNWQLIKRMNWPSISQKRHLVKNIIAPYPLPNKDKQTSKNNTKDKKKNIIGTDNTFPDIINRSDRLHQEDGWVLMTIKTMSLGKKHVHLNRTISMWYILNNTWGPSWSWSYGTWIWNYLCNRCLSPLKMWVQIPLIARCTRYNIMWRSLSVTCNGSGYSVFLHQ